MSTVAWMLGGVLAGWLGVRATERWYWRRTAMRQEFERAPMSTTPPTVAQLGQPSWIYLVRCPMCDRSMRQAAMTEHLRTGHGDV